MQMFSCLRMYMFLGVVFLFVGGAVDAQESLEILGVDPSGEVEVGDIVEAVFFASIDGNPAVGVKLMISHSGIGDVTVSNDGITNFAGVVVVKGTILGVGNIYIAARWVEEDLYARADCPCLPRLSLAQTVFNQYKETFRHPDVHQFFPDVLRAFKSPEIQEVLHPNVINLFVRDPRFIWNFYPDVDDSIVVLLVIDEGFQALFRDEVFHDMLQSPTEIDRLIGSIQSLEPRLIENDCQILPPATLSIVSGYGQEDEPGSQLRPFVVEVRDQYGDVFSGVNVVFRPTQGGGSVSPTTARTDSLGRAQTTLMLGSSAGVNVVEASVSGISPPQIFTAIATASDEPPKAMTVSIVSGYGQEGEPGTPLSDPFVVEVRDQYGNALSGVNVSFSATQGGGSVSPTTARTNRDGRAQTTLTLGSSPGANWVVANVSGISLSQTFTATATGRIQPTVSAQLPPVYWVEGGALYYRPTSGEKRMLYRPRGATLTGGLAVDMVTRRVYWTEETDATAGRVRWFSLDDMNVRLLAEVRNGVPYGVAVGTDKSGERRVYWTTSNGKIQRINVDGSGFRQNLITGLNSPKHIAFDEKQRRLYWTEAGRIRSANPNGTKKILFKQGLGELGGIAVADGVVYWTEKAGNGQGRVKSMNGSGSNPKLLAVLESVPEGITVDSEDDRVYWTTSHGEIQSVSLDRESVQTVAVDVGRPVGIALGRMSSEALPRAAPSMNLEDSVESALLANYPNPFNPETWIPYQLSKPANVTVSIYSVNGALVRTLALGHQAAGIYQSKSRAVYWDGRNEFGERVASGLYFYTFTAGDFTATRKMLIRK